MAKYVVTRQVSNPAEGEGVHTQYWVDPYNVPPRVHPLELVWAPTPDWAITFDSKEAATTAFTGHLTAAGMSHDVVQLHLDPATGQAGQSAPTSEPPRAIIEHSSILCPVCDTANQIFMEVKRIRSYLITADSGDFVRAWRPLGIEKHERFFCRACQSTVNMPVEPSDVQFD